MDKPFSVNETIATAWEVAKKNIWIVMGFTAVQFVIMFIFSSILAVFFGERSAAGTLLQNIIIQLADAFIAVAMYQVFFKLIDDEVDIEFPDFVPNVMRALNFLLVKLIMGVIAVLIISAIAAVYFYNTPISKPSETFSWEMLPILILIAIPIFYMSIRLFFVLCFIVDQESGATESISQSWTLTSGHFWSLVWLFLLILGINILGALAFFVGLLFTIPFSSLILMIAYRQMVNQYTEEEEILIENQDKH
ncbi:MAG: hypothetical protein RI924_626 [Bacteroidota bacterium]|jgi:hypothetical protein